MTQAKMENKYLQKIASTLDKEAGFFGSAAKAIGSHSKTLAGNLMELKNKASPGFTGTTRNLGSIGKDIVKNPVAQGAAIGATGLAIGAMARKKKDKDGQ